MKKRILIMTDISKNVGLIATCLFLISMQCQYAKATNKSKSCIKKSLELTKKLNVEDKQNIAIDLASEAIQTFEYQLNKDVYLNNQTKKYLAAFNITSGLSPPAR